MRDFADRRLFIEDQTIAQLGPLGGKRAELEGRFRQDITAPETVQLDLMKHRTVLQTVETEHGPIKVVGSGFRLEHGGGSVERPPATLGQHTDEVLGEAGYSTVEIAEMRKVKVV